MCLQLPLSSRFLWTGLLVVFAAEFPTAWAEEFQPPMAFLRQHCTDCHSGPTAENGLDLESLSTNLAIPATQAKWVRVYDRVQRGEMPPSNYGSIPGGAKTSFLGNLGRSLTHASASHAQTTLRRLNRTEYENTLNDLLGTRESLATLLPEDGKSHGFDNVGSALDLSAVHLERYIAAATQAIDAATHKSPPPERTQSVHSLADGRNASNIGKHWLKLQDGAVVLFNNGGFPRPTLVTFSAPHEGLYRIRIRGRAYQANSPISFELWQGIFAGRSGVSEKIGTYEFQPGGPQSVDLDVRLKPGATFVLLPRLQANFAELRNAGPAAYQGQGLAISAMEIDGPIIDQWPGRGHELLFGDLPTREVAPANPAARRQRTYRPVYELVSKSPLADAERLLKDALPKIYRRPTNDADVKPLLDLVRDDLSSGGSIESALRLAYVAAFCSPDFLYLREPAGTLDDFALASRLSYTFWNTLPDEELVQLAVKRQLSKPEILRSQTERLLNDPRSARFIRNFTGQWLNLRDMDFTVPDKQLYPEFDNDLKEAMVAETELFFAEVLQNRRSLLDFVDSDWTVLNERLAQHYGIPGVKGPEMRRVSLKPEYHRGGVLTHASVLKVSANGTTTSPVTRGVFVLERFLGVQPPAPPPGVPGVEPDIRGATTLREQLVKHRAIESCNNCHKLIDPPGFALENYDVTGGWRDHYRSLGTTFPMPSESMRRGVKAVKWRVGPKVDATGETLNGTTFNNLADYKKILLAQPEVFTKALTEKFATYATGREMVFADRDELERLTQHIADKRYVFRDAIHAVIQSPIFRNK